MLDVALHGGERWVRRAEISDRQRVPPRYIEEVLRALVRAGILDGKRGRYGGYRLRREPRCITLGEIVRVVRALEVEIESFNPDTASPLAYEVVWPAWKKVQDDLMAQLNNLTIGDLCQGVVEGAPDQTARQPAAV
ncbi:Rrf2 family transcriptional regulator [Reyranella soli]|uniref:Rrf2 family transcriptional regulator n=1 Tax=Reyranella soli TaxID=1230389 RepID=A0A512NSE5_9HYPH|nr:Rrf2 family transcriptional regulator [Reyranella soli]